MRFSAASAITLATCAAFDKGTATPTLNCTCNIIPEAGIKTNQVTGHTFGVKALEARSLPANPAGSYAPQTGNCPEDAPHVRLGGQLSPQELEWLPTRRNATLGPMTDLLSRLNITGLDVDEYIQRHRENASALPNIGIACSGGGYRAMLACAGVVEAFDIRTTGSTEKGQLGGILQSATYISGLSGGNWMVGSLYTNNFTSVQDIVSANTSAGADTSLWQLGNSIFEGPAGDGIRALDTLSYFKHIKDAVSEKKDAGYNTTITDYWGRALSHQLVNASRGGPEYTFSSIASQTWFSSGSAPMPFSIALGRRPDEIVIPANATVLDINPWEIGSEDASLRAFAPLKYIGSNFSDGRLESKECVTGFDNVGFVMGTSSSLFNQAFIKSNASESDNILKKAIKKVLGHISEGNQDIADWVNPFYNFSSVRSSISQAQRLALVDGGEDGQNIPFHPLIQKSRHVDVIFAVDATANTKKSQAEGTSPDWPNGKSMMRTYERQQSDMGNATSFPSVPDINTFTNLGLNSKPTFFGCNASNETDATPLIVYLPNAPYVSWSNLSTYDMTYNNSKRDATISNGYNLATQGNGTLDEQWSTCVGCAIITRSLERTKTEVPDVCTACFNKYCWDGTIKSDEPKAYAPAMKLEEIKLQSLAAERLVVHPLIAAVPAAVLCVLMVA